MRVSGKGCHGIFLCNTSSVSFSLVAFCWVTEVGEGGGEGGQPGGKKQ